MAPAIAFDGISETNSLTDGAKGSNNHAATDARARQASLLACLLAIVIAVTI